jgi:hypothetical protein
MSNFHFDLSLKLSQGEVHDFSGEVQTISGEVRTSPHLPSKSGHDFNLTLHENIRRIARTMRPLSLTYARTCKIRLF